MTKKLVIYSWRAGNRDGTPKSMTVSELIDYLWQFDGELPVVVQGFDGYHRNGIFENDGSIEVIDD